MPYTIDSSTATAQIPAIDPDLILQDILAKYPRLAAVHDPGNTFAMFASPERMAKAQGRRLEYWPADETGTPDEPHPAPGATVLELYDPKYGNDEGLMRNAIIGDLLHGLRNDPQFELMRRNFANNYSPQTWKFELDQGMNPNDESRIDAYIRGYLAPDENDEFRKAYNSGAPVWSPAQLRILGNMKKYVGLMP